MTKSLFLSDCYIFFANSKTIRPILLSRKTAIWRKLRSAKSTHSLCNEACGVSCNSARTTDLFNKYKLVANECKQAILNFDSMCEERVLGANNLGAFYRFVNSKMGRMNGIAPLLDPMGNLLLSDQEKADLLNNYFCSVFTEDNGRLPNFKSRIPADDPGICDIEINQQVIHRIILKLKSSTGPGPDGLPAVFFKHTISSITFPLSVLFRSFMDLVDLPSEWKEAVITPIFKKANPSECCNYRPIAITCICCKLFELIVVSNLLDYLNDRNLINNCQHGFF